MTDDDAEAVATHECQGNSAPDAEAEGVESKFRPLAEEVRELECLRITQALEATGGNKTAAAKLISMPVRTLHDRVRRHNLDERWRKKHGH